MYKMQDIEQFARYEAMALIQDISKKVERCRNIDELVTAIEEVSERRMCKVMQEAYGKGLRDAEMLLDEKQFYETIKQAIHAAAEETDWRNRNTPKNQV